MVSTAIASSQIVPSFRLFSYSVLSLSVAAGLWTLWRISKDDHGSDEDTSATKPNTTKANRHLKLPPHLERELAKEERRKQMIALFTMKKPMYDNILMHDPQGNLLCTISKKKANWYVVKMGLAKWLETDKSIQLLFQPRKPALDEKDPRQEAYNKTTKANCCVVCGEGKEYMRHYVVPFCYRSQFPKAFKTHLPHDVVLLCADCHVKAEQSAHKRMRRIERKLRTDPDTEAPTLVDRKRHKIASSAQALLKWKHKLPESRIEEYQCLLKDWLKDSDEDTDSPPIDTNAPLSPETLSLLTEIDFRSPNPKFISGPDLVMATLTNDDLIRDFIISWRSAFMETMHPRFLPTGWSVDSPVWCDKREEQPRTA